MGKVVKWNRAADPNTSKLTSFGFCDFEEPQGVWRALQFLHEKQLCDKRLLVKCEERAQQTIDEWKVKRKDELEERRKKRLAEAKNKKEKAAAANKNDEGKEEEKEKDVDAKRDGED